MRETFTEKEFNPEHQSIIDRAVSICNAYRSQGYRLSLRQLYYQFISADAFPNTDQNYKRLGGIISDARYAGLIDWDMIEDRGRETTTNPHWGTPADILDSAASSFGIDLWKGQENHVEVMVEKDALSGVLEPVCRELDVPFTANKGYSSSSALYVIAKRLERKADKGKDLHVIYLGDHDPSGIDMTRDVRERLETLSWNTVTVHRVALNLSQIEEYDPPPNPAKLSDSRADKYIERYGRQSWELDALRPEVLAAVVTGEVMALRDEDLFQERKNLQEDWRQELKDYAARFRDESEEETGEEE